MLGELLVLVGAILILLSSLGILRFDDVFARALNDIENHPAFFTNKHDLAAVHEEQHATALGDGPRDELRADGGLAEARRRHEQHATRATEGLAHVVDGARLVRAELHHGVPPSRESCRGSARQSVPCAAASQRRRAISA